VIAAISIPLFKKAFSDILESMALTSFSWGKSPDPHFSLLFCVSENVCG